jgi:hypothetical protein
VSDTPLPNVGSSDAEIVDETVQRAGGRFALRNPSIHRAWQRSPLALTPPTATNGTFAARAFDSPPARDSTTALGDVLAKVESPESDMAVTN